MFSVLFIYASTEALSGSLPTQEWRSFCKKSPLMIDLKQQQDDLLFMAGALGQHSKTTPEEAFHVLLEGFEGPLDILLMLAKTQKLDLMKISISALADQYILFIKTSQKLRLELAADYLVMAAWLAFLKSKLLLPPEVNMADEISAEDLSLRLQYQLARLNAFREATENLFALPQKGKDFFERGTKEALPEQVSVIWTDTLYDILMGYGTRRMMNVRKTYHVRPPAVMSGEDALKRLLPMIGAKMDWTILQKFLPEMDDQEEVIQRSAIAGTLVACLELAKRGMIELQQKNMFGDIYIRSVG